MAPAGCSHVERTGEGRQSPAGGAVLYAPAAASRPSFRSYLTVPGLGLRRRRLG